jgi:hypothetical protein
MNSAVLGRSAEPGSMRSGSIVPLAIVTCCAVIGLDQVLHTTPAALHAAPLAHAVIWAGNVVLAVPFAAAALWAGGWLGGRLGISMTGVAGVFAQACVVTLVLAVLLVPAWFGHYAVDSLAPVQALSAGPASIPAAHAGHSHGAPAPVELSWIGNGMFYLLMSIPLAAAAACVSQRVANRLTIRLVGETDVIVRVMASAGAVALGLAAGWFLQGVADQASGLLVYANNLHAVHLHHLAHAHVASVTASVVSPPFGYRLAQAVRDGLAGQAIGLPVTFAGLLWLTRRLRGGRQDENTINQART